MSTFKLHHHNFHESIKYYHLVVHIALCTHNSRYIFVILCFLQVCLVAATAMAVSVPTDREKRGVLSSPFYSDFSSSYWQKDFLPPTTVEVTNHVAIPVPHPVAVPIIKKVPYAVPAPYPVAVPRPYAVHVPVKVPYTVEKPYPVHVDKPYPVHIPVKVPYAVPKPYAVPYPAPYAVPVPKAVHVGVPTPYIVPKPYAVAADPWAAEW